MGKRPYWALERTADAASEPVTAVEAKTHIRETLSDSSNDSYIETLIAVARQHVEQITGRALITQTWKMRMAAFPPGSNRAILIPLAPVSAVTVDYIDTDGNSQTWAASKYLTDFVSVPARVEPAPGETYPGTQSRIQAVTVTITAGYGSAGDVPAPIKHAIKLLVGEMYERRELAIVGSTIAKVPFAVESLLSPYRVWDWGHASW